MAAAQDQTQAQDQTEEIATALLLAAIAAERFGVDMTARIMARFRQMEREIASAVIDLDVRGQPTPAQRRTRLEELEDLAQDLVLDTYDEIVEEVSADLRTVAETSEGSIINALIAVFGPEYAVKHLKTVPAERLHEIADEALFEGATVPAWFEQQARDAAFRVQRALAEADANASDLEETVETIRGSRESWHTDGIFQQPKRNAEALIMTGVAAVLMAARLATFEANAETVRMVGQQSVIDSRTSEICMAYSGKKWRLPDYEPVGHALPFLGGTPRHWRCRSLIIPIFGDGSVPGWTYEQWLRTRPEDEQRDILGPSRWELWRNRKLQLSDLLDQRGNPLSVAELKRRFGRRQPD
jgi:hypothetical protein